MKFLVGWRVLVCSSLLTSAFFSLANWFWYGKVYSDGVVSHDPARIQGLCDVRRPQTASELTQLLQAANWLRTSLPRMAELVEPLRVCFGTAHGMSFA